MTQHKEDEWTEEDEEQWLLEQSTLTQFMTYAQQKVFVDRFISESSLDRDLFQFNGREYTIEFCWYLHGVISDNEKRQRTLDIYEIESAYYAQKAYDKKPR